SVDRSNLALGYGVLCGGVLQNIVAGLAVCPLLREAFSGVRARVSLRPFLRRLMPTIFGLGSVQAVALLNIYFASRLVPGTLSYMYFADRLLELPLSLVAVSLGSALLPTLAGFWQRGDQA